MVWNNYWHNVNHATIKRSLPTLQRALINSTRSAPVIGAQSGIINTPLLIIIISKLTH
jgi:hypothetical protein